VAAVPPSCGSGAACREGRGQVSVRGSPPCTGVLWQEAVRLGLMRSTPSAAPDQATCPPSPGLVCRASPCGTCSLEGVSPLHLLACTAQPTGCIAHILDWHAPERTLQVGASVRKRHCDSTGCRPEGCLPVIGTLYADARRLGLSVWRVGCAVAA
jgi:hypothetical protein